MKKRRYKMDPGNSLMYQAIEDHKLEDIKLLLENGIDVNEPIITTGEFAGFTALHVACMKGKNHLVELLVNDYKADVNAMATDGTQPIHLACFYEPISETNPWQPEPVVGSIIKSLVKANANVDAEFGQEIFSKHVKDREWCPDFGDKMPIVAYTVIYDKPSIINHLKKVNLDIISRTNKTLLMYAVEKECVHYNSYMMSNVDDPWLRDKLINHRDNDDVPLTHYLLHPKKYGIFRYQDSTVFYGYDIDSKLICNFVSWGADMYALINDDPATFLPNLSAYRSLPTLMKYSLPYYTSMSLLRVLYYASLPIDEMSDHLVCVQIIRSEFERHDYLEQIRENREVCIEIALSDLIFRSTFRLPVLEEEIKLMDELISSDENLRWIVDNYKKNFIGKVLQDHFIEFSDNKMTMYDFFMQVFDDKKLKFLAREEDLLDALDNIVLRQNDDFSRFYEAYRNPIKIRIKDAKERLRLLENLKKISSLRKAIPLPFELVLDIVEYLN
ncbi:GSCOCG00004682001-RA-CDS, partial [Cotesia congregata]